MKNLVISRVLSAVFLTGVLSLQLSSAPFVRAQGALGQDVAGTYFYRAEAPELPEMLGLLTMLSDGTFLVSHTRQFGAGDPAANGFLSLEHAAWEPRGPRVTASSSLTFVYDANDGTLMTFFRVDGEFAVTEGFDSFAGPWTVGTFLLPRPLDWKPPDPNGIPDKPAAIGQFDARRLTCPGDIPAVAGQGGGGTPGDVNCDEEVNLTDAVYLLRYLFQGGPEPLECPEANASFGENLVGTYLYSADLGELPPFLGLVTMNSGGSFLVSNTRQFGAGDREGNGFLSLEHGKWRQIGPREMGICSLIFGYRADTGELDRILRNQGDLSLGRNLMELNGPFWTDVFLPGQNPLVDVPAAQALVGTISGRRLTLGAGDLNCDGQVNLTDPVYLLQHLFRGGPAPVACPGPGDQVVGTYLYRAEVEGLPPWLGFLTVTADGNYLASDSRQFGAGARGTAGDFSVQHGIWKPLGERDLKLRGLLFDYDPNGDLEGIEQFRTELSFAEKFDTLTGEFTIDHYGPDQDPTVEPPAMTVRRGTLAAVRLEVQ